jgi:hypothetical protein
MQGDKLRHWVKTRIVNIRRIDCRIRNASGGALPSQACYTAGNGLATVRVTVSGAEPGMMFVTVHSSSAIFTQINLTDDYTIQSIKLEGIRPRIVDGLQAPQAVPKVLYLRPAGMINPSSNVTTNLQYIDSAQNVLLSASPEMDVIKLRMSACRAEDYVQPAENIIVGTSLGQVTELWITDIKRIET